MKKFLIAAVLLLIPVMALAQGQTTGSVVGTVMDEDGNPVQNARIVFLSDKLQGERSVSSSANGSYLAALLPSGLYTMEVTAPGFTSQTVTFRLAVGAKVPLDVKLKKGSDLTEEITVYSTPVEMETTAIGETLNYSEDVDKLPIQARTLGAVARFAPNVSFGPASSGASSQQSTTLSISGAPSYDTVYLLDGAEISDPLFGGGTVVYLEDAIEEVQVMTSGISARYGRFQGGVINAITKSGGNKFSGTARWEFDRESWNSTSPFGETLSEKFNNRYWATLGGFVMKDHLWFFGGHRTIPATTDTRTSTTYGSPAFFNVARTSEEDRNQLKLRGAINSNHVIDVSWLEFESAQTPRAALPFVDGRAGTGTRSDPREAKTATYQGVLTPNLFADLQWTEKEASIVSGANVPSFGSPVLDWSGTQCPGFCVLKNHWWGGSLDPDQRDNATTSLNFTQTINSSFGTHTLEYGGAIVETTTGGKNSQSITGLNLVYDTVPSGSVAAVYSAGTDTATFNLDPSWLIQRWNAPAVGLPAGGFSANLEDTAFYVQDSLEYGKWRFDGGLRYETYDGNGPFIAETVNFDDIAPRFGVTYNLDQNWQLQANWGKYVARINDNQSNAVTFVGENPSQTELYTGPVFSGLSYDDAECVLRGWAPGDPGCDPANPVVTFGPNDMAYWGTVLGREDPNAPTTFLLPDFEAPHANDLNLSVRRRLPRNTGTVTFTYTQRDFEALTDDFVGGVTLLFDGLPSQIQDVDTTMDGTIDLFGVVNIDTDADGTLDTFVDATVWGNAPQARREYEAVTATFDYRPSPKWNIGGNYTFSQTTGNYEGEGANTPGTGSAIGNYQFSRPDAFVVPDGFLDEDIRHRAQAWGTYNFDFEKAGNLTIGSVLIYQSGRAYSRTATVGNGDDPRFVSDGSNSSTYFFDGRGNNRHDGWYDLNLSARYQIPIWKSLNAWVKADVRNALDGDALIDFNTSGSAVTNAAGQLEFAPGGSFGNAANRFDYQLPRTYLFTVGLSF